MEAADITLTPPALSLAVTLPQAGMEAAEQKVEEALIEVESLRKRIAETDQAREAAERQP